MEIFLELLKAFIVGGIICLIGQILIDLTKLTPARVLVIFVVVGVVLGGVGVYEYVEKFGGAGATLPLVGFGYNLAKETKTAVQEQGLLGALEGPLSAASVGTMAAIICGLISSIVAKPKDKK
ncbi:MAG: SpoVA/SpoVAEb family sporulation membrane protein [Acutalibacteraceae bacterium]